MHASMPPETTPPDDERRGPSSSEGAGNVVDPQVLAERRAQRAEQAEQAAARRATDAQVLAAQLARERARLEAERDAARAEAGAAREGADAAIAEARHLQAERDELREALIRARRERDQLAAAAAGPAELVESAAPAEPAPAAPPSAPAPIVEPTVANGAGRNGHGAVPAAWAAGLRRELAVARTAAAIVAPPAPGRGPSTPVPGLARERRLVVQRAERGPIPAAKPALEVETQRRDDRAAPITALALERERSSRLQAQLDSSLAVQRELRTHIAALQRAIHQRVEAERRIEAALRRVREELAAANALAVGRAVPAAGPAVVSAPAGPPRAAAGSAAPSAMPMPPAAAAAGSAAPSAMPMPPAAPADVPAPAAPASPPAPAAEPVAPSARVESVAPPTAPSTLAPVVPREQLTAPAPAALDPLRLSAAHERLRASVPPTEEAGESPDEQQPSPLPVGLPAPWLTEALQRLLADEPETAGRIAVGVVPAQGLAAEKPFRYDLLLAGRGCLAVDVVPGAPAAVVQRSRPRPRGERDLSVAGDAIAVARLLYGRRTLLRRRARVRGGRRALRELRRLARAPLGLRDLGAAGVALEPALALRLLAFAIDPGATAGERFAVAHAPLAGGPVDAWLRIADGAEPAVVTQPPAEPTRLTLRCTRGALLALIAGVEPPPGESGTLDGDDAALALLRSWIARTEHPAG